MGRVMLAAAMALGVVAAPALADVKAGVDAWARGDYAKAIDEWRGPAVAGDPDAQFNLGQAYKLGRGVPVNIAIAEDWYRKAAEQGHPQAADNYGLALFQSGKRDQAVPWLEKSATRGEPRAQYVLGTMLFNGDVVKRDWVRAYALMTRASGTGLEQASSTLAQMDKYVSLADRQKGVELARRYEADAARPVLAEVTAPAVTPPAPRPQRPIATTQLPPSRPATPPPTVAEPRPTPPAPRPAAVAASGDWRVQLGAFGQPGGAQRLWSQVAAKFPGRQPYYVKSGTLTRLLVGPYASQAEAARGCGSVKPCVPMR